jgi:hypothetical protein
MWGALEVLVEDFIVGWAMNEPTALKNERILAVRITFGDFESLQREDQIRYLLREVRDSQKPRKFGIDSFETLFADFGLPAQYGKLLPSTRRDLVEMYQVRNVLVHKGSLVDTRFVQICPWTGFIVGQRLQTSTSDVDRYTEALGLYAGVLFYRVITFYGGTPADYGMKDENTSGDLP